MPVGVRLPNGQAQVNVDKAPSVCPICHNSIVAVDLNTAFQFDSRVERVYQCPNTNCQVLFLARYARQAANTQNFVRQRCVPFEFRCASHTETIGSISKDFCEIYGQAEKAEQHGLSLVAGPGYRKALEFLMKDYASFLRPSEKASIEKIALASCITM
jgi:hypothetical protein